MGFAVMLVPYTPSGVGSFYKENCAVRVRHLEESVGDSQLPEDKHGLSGRAARLPTSNLISRSAGSVL